MLTRIDYEGISWVDLQSPSPEDIERISNEFELHPLVVEELGRPSFRPKAENFGGHLYLILHLPIYDFQSRQRRSRELDLVVGKNFLLTVHYDAISAVSEFFRSCELSLALRTRLFQETSLGLLSVLWERLYENLLAEMDHIQRKIDRIEDRIFAGQEEELIEDISLLRRDILDFSRAVRPHDTVLESLSNMGLAFFGEEFTHCHNELSGRYRRIMTLIRNHKDTLETLYDTNDSLLTHRSNEIIKTLTMLALLTFPLTLIASIFSIEAAALPIVGQPNDFWIILGIMIVTVLAMLTFFRHRRWI